MSISITPTCLTRRSRGSRPPTKCIFLRVPNCQSNSSWHESLRDKQGENRIWRNVAMHVLLKRKLSQSIQCGPIPPNGNYSSKRRQSQKTNCLSSRNYTQNEVHNHPSNAIPSEAIPNSNRPIADHTIPKPSRASARLIDEFSYTKLQNVLEGCKATYATVADMRRRPSLPIRWLHHCRRLFIVMARSRSELSCVPFLLFRQLIFGR